MICISHRRFLSESEQKEPSPQSRTRSAETRDMCAVRDGAGAGELPMSAT
jgi:hypothetical protein